MFIIKKKYYLIIENTKDIKLNNIKKKNKFIIIYRNDKTKEKIDDLYKFKAACRKLLGFRCIMLHNAALRVLNAVFALLPQVQGGRLERDARASSRATCWTPTTTSPRCASPPRAPPLKCGPSRAPLKCGSGPSLFAR
mgnify:CR=1 FL=1